MKRPSNDDLRKMTFKTKNQVLESYEKVRQIINKQLLPKYFNIKISHDYLLKRVPKFKLCLHTKKINSYTIWCLPKYKPKKCPKSSWKKLKLIQLNPCTQRT